MPADLSSLKVKALKHVAFLTGCIAPTKKSDLVSRLDGHLKHALIPKYGRVLSIDMGIRNLAYCVLQAQGWNDHGHNAHQSNLRIDTWERLDLLQQLRTAPMKSGLVSANTETNDEVVFNPERLSRAAYSVAKSLMEHRPDIILIEQQRFRSGGGSAIQEWTVRVNMLESMLWACFETLKQTSSSQSPTLYSVSPARVAKFWIAGRSMPLLADYSILNGVDSARSDGDDFEKSKITKSDKIEVLKGWLEANDKCEVALTFSDDASDIAGHFMGSKRRRRAAPTGAPSKLDDLADCLLQGAAWFHWERNRQLIHGACMQLQ